MTRTKLVTMAAALGFCALSSAQINAATPVPLHIDSMHGTMGNTSMGNTPMVFTPVVNAPIKNAAAPQQLSYIEEIAAESLHPRSMQVNAEAVTFAGPYDMFVTEPSTPLSDYSSSGMMLASLGLMALIVRRRINM